MEVIAHGTNGGYRILYKTQNAPPIASDIRNNASSETSLGKSVYAIAFVANGSVFSKYKIIKDSLRSSATGFIAFSLFLPTGEKLAGVDAKSILDELQDHYVSNYITTNQMNRGERTQIIQEEWTFINDILSKYNTTKDFSSNQLHPGTKEPAFIYYNGDGELIEYLAKPFQEEFCDYKQVFFINNDLKENSDVLDVLRNSGSELNIDLKNEYYYLNNYEPNKYVTITANGKTRSGGKNDNVIRANDKVGIKYKKDDRFYVPIEVNGTLSDPSSKIHKYLVIKGNQINIDYAAFNKREAKTKTISFDIKDRNGISINNAEIKCNANHIFKNPDNNEIIFSGEDLGKNWTVSAKSGENLFLDNHPIDFERDCPGDTSTVRLQLNERKTVSFLGNLKGISVTNINVSIESRSKKLSPSTFEFLNEEIGKTHKARVDYQAGSDKFYGEKSFSPKGSHTVDIDLQKLKKYIIDLGSHAKRNQNLPEYSYERTGEDVKKYIKPKRGWKFTGFKREDSRRNNDGKLVAQYQKNHKPVIVTSLILSVLIISAGVWWIMPTQDIENYSLTESQIEKYVEGVELNLDTLNSYKAKWENQNSEDIKEENSAWYNPITWLKNEEKTSKPIEDDNWKKASEWIDRAIAKRNSIDQLDFKLLKDSVSTKYSTPQQKFKRAIKVIDSTQYDTIQKTFKHKDLGTLNLDEIAEAISHFLNPRKVKMDESNDNGEVAVEKESDNSETQKSETTSDKSTNNTSESLEQSETEQTQAKETGSQNKGNEIKRDLQSSTITKSQLEEYQKDPGAFKNSIDLYLQFWQLVKSNNNQKNDFDNLLKKVKNDKTLKNSELKKFLDSICKNSNEFQKYVKVRGRATIKTVNELNDKIK